VTLCRGLVSLAVACGGMPAPAPVSNRPSGQPLVGVALSPIGTQQALCAAHAPVDTPDGACTYACADPLPRAWSADAGGLGLALWAQHETCSERRADETLCRLAIRAGTTSSVAAPV